MYLIKLPLPLLHSTLQNHSMRSTLPIYTPPILHLIGKAERWEVFFNTLLTGHLTGLWHAALEGVELNMSRGKITPEPFFLSSVYISICEGVALPAWLYVWKLTCLLDLACVFFLTCWWHAGLTADLGFTVYYYKHCYTIVRLWAGSTNKPLTSLVEV